MKQEIHKIAIIGLMIRVLIGFAQVDTEMSTPITNPLESEMEQECDIEGNYPKVGEIFEVLYKIRLKPNIQPTYGNEYCVGFSYAYTQEGNVEVFTKPVLVNLSPGEWHEFRGQFLIKKAVPRIGFWGGVAQKGVQTGVYAGVVCYLINSLTGQYGTRDEYDKQLRKDASWWYDHAGEFTNEPVSPDCAARNREIIAQLKQMEPNLTDWEALYLHYDGIQALMDGMGTQKTTWEERWRFLLEIGWLEKQRAGKEIKEKWLKELIEKYKGKPLIKEQGLYPNFFRDNSDSVSNNSGLPDSTQTRWSYFYFNGQFRYKKHQYNKDQGLLAETVAMPICSVLVRVRAYWSGQGTIWTIRTNTDANGYFHATLSWEVPQNINIYAHPIIYFWGPTPANKVIKVSDPTPTIFYL